MKGKIAKLIKKYRLAQSYSQKSLAEGICAQAIVSRIEKAEISPSVDIFFKLIKKLNIPLDEVAEAFDMSYQTSQSKASFQESSGIDELLEKRDYQAIKQRMSLVDYEQLSLADQYYYKYVEGILSYTYDDNATVALKKLNDLEKEIQADTTMFNLYINILQSKVSILSAVKNVEKANDYLKQLEKYLPIIKSKQMVIKIYFTSSRHHYVNLKNLDKSLELANEGIKVCVENKLMYLLGDLLLIKANILRNKQMFDTAMEYCQQSILIFNLTQNFVCLDYALNLNDELSKRG